MTLAEAIREARAQQARSQCANGRHVRGCPHRPLPWWAQSIPVRDDTGSIKVRTGYNS